MLNKALYSALRSRFPGFHIQVVNPDVPAVYSLPKAEAAGFLASKSLRRYLEVAPSASDWGETYQMNCPICMDTRSRLFIGHATNAKIIPTGQKSTWHFPVIAVCHNEHCAVRRLLQDMPSHLEKEAIDSMTQAAGGRQFIRNKLEFMPKTLPLSSSDVPAQVIEYVESRGFDPDYLFREFDVRCAPTGTIYQPETDNKERKMFFEDRLFIPIIQSGEIISWQARLCRKADRYKYIFPDLCEKSKYLYNMDRAWANETDTVVVCEGVTDVWKIGHRAVAIFGKSMSETQLDMLRILCGWHARIVLLLDPDAKATTQKLLLRMCKEKMFRHGVTYLELAEGYDAADYSTSEINALIDEAATHCSNNAPEEFNIDEYENLEV